MRTRKIQTAFGICTELGKYFRRPTIYSNKQYLMSLLQQNESPEEIPQIKGLM